LPGAVHDLTAARTHTIIESLTSANVITFADKAYRGARGSIRTPFKRHRYRPKLTAWQKKVNRAHARIRAIGERANATLKTWKSSPGCAAARTGRPRSCKPSSPYITSRTRPTEDEKALRGS
jgi:DDE superfamily endonuclease